MKVEVLESGLVAPSEETPGQGIWLSNLDLLVARAHTPTVYFYRPTTGTDVGGMRAALGGALVPFYPLAGRLGHDRSGRVQISCTGEGALFVVARSGSAVKDLGGFGPSDEMRQLLVPSVGSGDLTGILLMVQVTFFECGGVCLGIALHHTVADGLGALHFVKAWSDIARGVSSPTAPPFLDRTLLAARSPPTVLFDHPEYSQCSKPKPFTTKSPFDSAILDLSKAQLETLKNGNGNKGISTFKAVVAHVWRTTCHARQLTDGQETRLYMTVDARNRLHPRLPSGYFGNAIFRASATAKAGELMSSSLEFGAEKVQSATSRLGNEHVRSLVDFLELQEDVRGMAKGAWKLSETDLWVISWQGLPIYEADFGWGRPLFMGRACLQFAGLVYVVPSPGNTGGLSIVVALEPENMQRFKELFYEDLVGCGV